MNKPVAQRYRPRENENRPRASLSSWFLLQESLAKGIGIALLTLDEKSEPIGRAENNNSICEAMRASAPHAELCALECGRAADMKARSMASPNFNVTQGSNVSLFLLRFR